MVTPQDRKKARQRACGGDSCCDYSAFAVIIYFTDIEPAEFDYFARELVGHDVRVADRLGDVGVDAEAVSAFIGTPIDTAFLITHPQLRLVATRSQAVDHIDLAACRGRGVCVTHVPNYGETTVAEHTFALMLATCRRLRELMLKPKGAHFSYEATRALDLAGCTLGIFGFGRVGSRVAALALAFRMKVIVSDVRTPNGNSDVPGVEWVTQDELFGRADIITLHVPLTPETYHFISRENLARCCPGVIIINTARGALVDTAALIEALDSGHVGGAGLDVLEDERVLRESAAQIIAGDIVNHLRSDGEAHEARDADRIREVQELMLGDAVLSRSNVIFTPHVAFNSIQAVQRLRAVTVENIRAFAAGAPGNMVGI